jgi:short-subunit dehydrogenase
MKNQIIVPGSVAVVTGASSGIGEAIAGELARAGLHVYALARRLPDYFADPSSQHDEGDGFIRPVRCDVNREEELVRLLEQIVATEGRLDCLVQSAGFGIAGALEDTSAHEARQQIQTNFFGAIHALPFVIRQMRNQKRGLIVQIGSVAGALPIPFQAYYSASKAALCALSLALDGEVAPWGIHCLLVQPGDTRTGFTQARQMTEAAASDSSAYAERCQRSVAKMAADEMGGATALAVARQIVRRMQRRRPPLIFTPGLSYKVLLFLARLVPLRLVRWAIRLMYAS